MSTHVITAPTTPSVHQGRWRLDPQRSSVEFHVPNFYGLQTVKGRFGSYEGTLELGAHPAAQLTIDAASLDTEHAQARQAPALSRVLRRRAPSVRPLHVQQRHR